MHELALDYGDGMMPVSAPEGARIVRYGETFTDPPEVDAAAEPRKALSHPLGMKPLHELAKAGDKVGNRRPASCEGWRASQRAP